MLLLCTWITNALTPSVNMETHLWVYRERGREGGRHYKLIGDILSTIVKGSVQRGRQEGLRGGQKGKRRGNVLCTPSESFSCWRTNSWPLPPTYKPPRVPDTSLHKGPTGQPGVLIAFHRLILQQGWWTEKRCWTHPVDLLQAGGGQSRQRLVVQLKRSGPDVLNKPIRKGQVREGRGTDGAAPANGRRR